MRNNLLIVGILLGCSQLTFAQQEPRTSFFWNNYMHTNPAMTGAHYKHHANAQWRNQWIKINGAPTTLWANYAIRLDSVHHAVGVSYEYDAIGMQKSHSALMTYAYHIPINNLVISLGVSAGLNSINFENSWSPPEISNSFGVSINQNMVQADFGLALRSEKWNVGISATQLTGPMYKGNAYTPAIHYWMFGDYTFKLGAKWKLTPRFQIYTDAKKTSSLVAVVASLNDRLWFGSSFATPQLSGFAVGPMLGYNFLGKYRIGYTYEFWTNRSSLGTVNNNGTHEIVLSLQLK